MCHPVNVIYESMIGIDDCCHRMISLCPSFIQAFAPGASQRDWILLFVAIEHGFLLLRVAIDRLIPDVSGKIKESMDRDEWMLRKHK